jgi:hypothetical protein
MELTAYKVDGAEELPIVPAPPRRQWHNDIPGIGACLPLTIANGAGWWLLNTKEFTVHRSEVYNYQVVVEPEGLFHVMSHFGFGVLTVAIPYVFKTPPGWELLVRGPSNVFYDGMHPFEGIVESDWHHGTATMNWMVEKGATLVIPEGAPLAQIVPTQVASLEEFQVKSEDMPEDIEEEFARFSQSRADRLAANKIEGKVRYEGTYPRNERTSRKVLKLAGIV